ncbi:MAG TPA: sulfate permease [Pseudomonadales bacterium]|nr:sulfate permease [Pseudomonadales bacterium]
MTDPAGGARRSRLRAALPAGHWLATYGRGDLGADVLASLIVTIMLIPQSLAYALLAGMPPEAGLYASILPAVFYAFFASSRVLAVGPVAVISLMTASALGDVHGRLGVDYAQAAALLALMSGAFLALLGVLRMGWLANFLSHAVISGFVSGSAVLIAVGQLRPLLGVDAGGDTLVTLVPALVGVIDTVNPVTLTLGAGTVVFLAFARSRLAPLLRRLGFTATLAAFVVRAGPVLAVVISILLVAAFALDARGVAVVGTVPDGLPPIRVPALDPAVLLALLPSAVLLSLVGFVESISVGQSLAMRRRQRLVPDQELLGLGAANIAAGLSGGFPVSGGFSRSVVNYDAGAVSPVAGLLTGLLMALVALVLTPAFHDLPRTVLAAVIIVAVLPLVDARMFLRSWRTARMDAVALAATALGVLVIGVEAGIAVGVGIAVGAHLWRSSRPHMAVVGRVPGTEHFRNVDRHAVQTSDGVLALRVDESLYFANARWLEDHLLALVTERPAITDVVLVCSAVNGIDGSAIETLTSINERLEVAGVRFHLSEVKGPVMDVLRATELPERLSGRIFFTQHEAMRALAPEALPGLAPVQGSGDGI